MTGDLVISGAQGALVLDSLGEDVFEIAFRPAEPTLDAVVEMWDTFRLYERERQLGVHLNDDRAADLARVIPREPRLKEIKTLFHEAEFTAAPEGWVHVAVGVMLASMPDAINIHDAYRCAITDSAYKDPSVWDGYGPGYSHAVVARAIRQARLRSGLPSPGDFIRICRGERKQFRRWREALGTLSGLRDRARTVLGEIGPDHPDWMPF